MRLPFAVSVGKDASRLGSLSRVPNEKQQENSPVMRTEWSIKAHQSITGEMGAIDGKGHTAKDALLVA